MIIPEFLSTSGDMIADRRFEYACGFAEIEDFDAAIDLLLQTFDLVPEWPVIPFQLGKFYKSAGNQNLAIRYFEKSIEMDPEDRQGAALELERLGISAVEENMPPAFVETLFDQYAERFDEHLVEALDYQVPQMIADLVGNRRTKDNAARILDLGCGTGLAGEYLSGHFSYLEGVDLSGGMLEKAAEKGLYHKLVQAEITEYLQSHNTAYDLIIAADVLSYFGALETLMIEAAKCLTPDGLFIFSVQALANSPPDSDQNEYYLGKARRFSHAEDYLRSVIHASGMHILSLEKAVLRKDEGIDVNGYLLVTAL